MCDLLQSQSDEDKFEAALEEGEVNTLRDALIYKGSPRGHGKKYKHILFAQNANEGMESNYDMFFHLILFQFPAFQ